MASVEEANSLSRIKNYLRAKGIYEELLSEDSGIRNRTILKEEIERCEREYQKSIQNMGIGEAQFPIYHQEEKCASIIKLKASTDAKGNIPLDIKNVIECLLEELSRILKRDDNKFRNFFHTFSWDLDKLCCYVEVADTKKLVVSKSYELAAAMAIISYIINIPVGADYIFTGTLASDKSKVRIGPVDLIDVKRKAVLAERPATRAFFVPTSNEQYSNPAIPEDNLGSVLSKVFVNFDDDLAAALYEYSDKEPKDFCPRLISLRLKEIEDNKGVPITIFAFKHPQIEDNEIKEAIHFLERDVADLIFRHSKGIVIDGLKLSCLTPVLVSCPILRNGNQNFIATRYSNPKESNAKACVVKTPVQTKDLKYLVGDVLEYKAPESKIVPAKVNNQLK